MKYTNVEGFIALPHACGKVLFYPLRSFVARPPARGDNAVCLAYQISLRSVLPNYFTNIFVRSNSSLSWMSKSKPKFCSKIKRQNPLKKSQDLFKISRRLVKKRSNVFWKRSWFVSTTKNRGERSAFLPHKRPIQRQIAEAVAKKSGQKIIFLSFFCQMYCVFQK